MDFETVNNKLTAALNLVMEKDAYLLEKSIHERSVLHRLAVYLEPLFPDFHVDCEYNGNFQSENGKKSLFVLTDEARKIRRPRSIEHDEEIIDYAVFPDIIVHRRGSNQYNLLVIEAKLSSSTVDPRWDAKKLELFTSDRLDNVFNYRYGIFLRFTVGRNIRYDVDWYQHGRRFA